MKTIKISLGILIFLILSICIIKTESFAKTENIEMSWSKDGDTYSDLYIGDNGVIICNTGYSAPIKIEYSSSNKNVVTVDSKGYYKVVGSGNATIRADIYYSKYDIEDGEPSNTFTCNFAIYYDASKTTLSSYSVKTYNLCQGAKVSFINAPNMDNCHFDYSCSNTNLGVQIEFDVNKKCFYISAYNEGNGVITLYFNNKTFKISIKSYLISINKDSLVIAKKTSYKLKIKNAPKKVKWISDNSKVVKVNSSGKIFAKKNGLAVVYASFDGNQIGCAVSVVSKGMKKVVDTAKMMGSKWKYSQAKRMSKGYYDCSSLVWRSYHKIGKNFGDKNYPPVAADIAKWCVSHKKMIKGGLNFKNILKKKYKPGDLFFETGANNNRYKGIYHVEMMVGYRCSYIENGKPMLNMCWAARPDNCYMDGKMMARP